jgi:DNA-directed RNA polymerase subunit RPC12/RpoP
MESQPMAGEFKFTCAECRRKLRIAVELAGSRIRCPACQRVIRVPWPATGSLGGKDLDPSWGQNPPAVEGANDPRARTLVYWRRQRPPTSLPASP